MLFEVSGGVGDVAVPESIPFGEVEGLAIKVDQVKREGGILSLRLLVTYSVPVHLRDCHPEPQWAFIAVARDLRTGRSESVSLRDPNVVPLVMPDPNFKKMDPRPGSFALGHWVVPMSLGVGEAEGHPGVLMHVALHEVLSNVVAVAVP